MRIAIYIATIGLIFSSCGNIATKKPVENSITVSKEMSKDEIRQDSINKKEEMIVFGNIRFGMNEKEFEQSKNEFIKKCTVYLDENKKHSQFRIGDYWFRDITGEFYNEKLHSVTIEGYSESYTIRHEEYFDHNMRIDYNALKSVLQKKYGKPEKESDFYSLDILDVESLNRGNIHELENWHIGDKIIQMNIVKYSSKDNSFRLNLTVYQESMIKLAQEDEERKAKIIKENEEQKRQEIIKKGVDVL